MLQKTTTALSSLAAHSSGLAMEYELSRSFLSKIDSCVATMGGVRMKCLDPYKIDIHLPQKHFQTLTTINFGTYLKSIENNPDKLDISKLAKVAHALLTDSVSIKGSNQDINYWKVFATNILFNLKDYNSLTGAGPGAMEAGLRASKLLSRFRKNLSGHGAKVRMDREPENPYLSGESSEFNLFPFRKSSLLKKSDIILVVPGGFGTLEEAFDAIVMTQAKVRPNNPIYLVGSTHWKPLYSFLTNMLGTGISQEIYDQIKIIDFKDIPNIIKKISPKKAFFLQKQHLKIKYLCQMK